MFNHLSRSLQVNSEKKLVYEKKTDEADYRNSNVM